MRKLIHATISLLLCVTMTTGCSLFKSSKQTIHVDTDPPHAQVWINRTFAGEAPVQQTVRRNQNVDIMVKKDGYETAQKPVGYHLNFTGVLDIVGAWLIILPLFGALAPGANSLDELQVVVKLAPANTHASSTNAPAPAPAPAVK